MSVLPGLLSVPALESVSQGGSLPKTISGGSLLKTILFRDSDFLLGWDSEESINQGKRRGHGGVLGGRAGEEPNADVSDTQERDEEGQGGVERRGAYSGIMGNKILQKPSGLQTPPSDDFF